MRRHTQDEIQAFDLEMGRAYKTTLSAEEIRTQLGLYTENKYGREEKNIKWRNILRLSAEICDKRDTKNKDEIMDMTDEIANIEDLKEATENPRMYADWLIRYYEQKVRKKERREALKREQEVGSSRGKASRAVASSQHSEPAQQGFMSVVMQSDAERLPRDGR